MYTLPSSTFCLCLVRFLPGPVSPDTHIGRFGDLGSSARGFESELGHVHTRVCTRGVDCQVSWAGLGKGYCGWVLSSKESTPVIGTRVKLSPLLFYPEGSPNVFLFVLSFVGQPKVVVHTTGPFSLNLSVPHFWGG